MIAEKKNARKYLINVRPYSNKTCVTILQYYILCKIYIMSVFIICGKTRQISDLNSGVCTRHGGLPAKGKEVFVYTSGLEIE